MNGLETTNIISALSIDGAPGRSLVLQSGEIVKAYVVDTPTPDSVSLRIKGRLITADTEIPLQKDAAVLVKVLGAFDSDAGTQLKLQFLKYSPDSSPTPPLENPEVAAVRELLRELSDSASDPASTGPGLGNIAEMLLKALPSDSSPLPQDVKTQLQEILLENLATTTEQNGSTQDRISALLSILEKFAGSDNARLSEIIPKAALVSVADLPATSLESLLKNTGIGLEAKLGSVAMEELFQREGAGLDSTGKPVLADAALTIAKEDLKAAFGVLRSLIGEQLAGIGDSSAKNLAMEGYGSKPEAVNTAGALDPKELLNNIESLLTDIQTFQALSIATDSYCSFLPIIWDGLKQGRIGFKKGGGGAAYYCMVNLDLARCGKLAVMILLQNSEFLVSFKADDPQFRSTLEIHARELRGIFASHGLRLKAVNVLGKEDTSLAPFEKFENLDALINITV